MSIVEQLIELLVVLVAAKVGAEVMTRLRQPPVIGELVMGMVIGIGGLGWVTAQNGGLLEVLAEIGVIILLYEVGLEIQLADMARLGRSATQVAIIGVVTPFALGVGAVQLLGIGGGTTETAIFVGAAMTATSVGITARVFGDLRRLDSDEAKTVIGAAVIDDVLGLVILAVVIAGLSGESTSAAGLAWLIARVIIFLVSTVAIGRLIMPRVLSFLRALRVPGSFVIGVLVLALTLGIAAERLAGLSPIVGAFVAGLIIGRAEEVERIQVEIRPIAHFFVPIFFLAVGARVDAAVLLEPSVLGAGLVITAIAAVGKLVAGLGAGGRGMRRSLIGVGMIPRGEVGLIFAALGASQLSSVVTSEDIAIIVLMVILTTLVPPLVLSRLLRHPEDPEPVSGPPG